jgi:monovalent cation:H+ antiporter-2, CPA2 family
VVSLTQVLLLLGATVGIVIGAQRLHIPSSLAYLLVGILLGPYTGGPTVDVPQLSALAEYGIVFLLFTIGLSFSLPQLQLLRTTVLSLGTGQVVLTTAVIGVGAWLMGLPPTAAFVLGAVFAQSSSTIIGKQLEEQGEQASRHGRLGLALSVFQDVTAVPFVVVIPVLGAATGAAVVAGALGMAVGKAILALALVIVIGRWVLGPLFRTVATGRSAEVFTLTVLLVALLSAWTTEQLGLSLAFGAFLAGMMLGETEFRHQVDAAVRPFRDVLLGLFFVGIGMLVDVRSLPSVWHLAIAGAVALFVTKTVLVAVMLRRRGEDPEEAWRTGLLLGVGGEFGFALLAIGIEAGVVDARLGQAALAAVLIAMVMGPIAIRYNGAMARWIVRATGHEDTLGGGELRPEQAAVMQLHDHVIIGGYGRIGQSVGHLLATERIPYVALDIDPALVRRAHGAGEPVYLGNLGDSTLLDVVGLGSARLLVIAHGDVPAALRLIPQVRRSAPELPILVRTRDASEIEALQAAGATHVVPEALEAGLMIASQSLLTLGVAPEHVAARIREERASRYPLMQEYFFVEPASRSPSPTAAIHTTEESVR